MGNITWDSWGGAEATGHGTSCYVPPSASTFECVERPVTIRVSNLGTCNGRPAYENLGWWFPGEGETFSGWNAENCEYGTSDAFSNMTSSDAVLGDATTAYYRGAQIVGFGIARPSTINQDPSSGPGITGIRWTSWGRTLLSVTEGSARHPATATRSS